MEKITYTNKISYKKVLKHIEDSLFKQHLEEESNNNMDEKKITHLLFNPNKVMNKFSLGLGLSSPKNGYISPEARQKAKLKRKRKNKK